MIIKPCVKCKSENVEVRDCGYTTFNPHWVECVGCGYRAKNSDTFGKNRAIRKWNKEWEDNEFVIDLQRLRKENEDLKKENDKLHNALLTMGDEYIHQGLHGQEINKLTHTLWVEQTSISGDSHSQELAHFTSEDKAKQILAEATVEEDGVTHFFVDTYIDHTLLVDPQSFQELK